MRSQNEVEVLCATMHQTDFSKANEMNIGNCNVIFANQADRCAFEEIMADGHTMKMITTDTQGVGKNRNFALAFARGDILVYADDDLRYENEYTQIISRAFEEFPIAEMIVFGIRYEKDGKPLKIRLPETGRLSFFKALRYGTCAIAIRREAVLKYNLRFSELFGGGCLYSYGEDTDFIVQCFRKHLRIYSYHAIIATTSKDTSTCYTGYGGKYFFDKGALARHTMGIMAIPYMFRMANKALESDLNKRQRLRFLWSGYKSFPRLLTYQSWVADSNEENNHRQ